MYSTPYILKLYILINLLFLILLVANDLNIYLVITQFISIYYGGRTIYCMIEGGCYKDIFSVFFFYFIVNSFTFLYIRNYIPKTAKFIKDVSSKFKNNIKDKFNIKKKLQKRHNKLEERQNLKERHNLKDNHN